MLGLDASSPLHLRKLRNNIEHMDERLDKWAEVAEREDDYQITARIILAGTPMQVGLDPPRCLLVFDANAHTLYFQRPEPLDLMPLSQAVYELADRIRPFIGAASGYPSGYPSEPKVFSDAQCIRCSL